MDTKFCPQNRTLKKKKTVCSIVTATCPHLMSLQHVPASCPCNMSPLWPDYNCRLYLFIDIKTAATRLLGVIKIRSASGNSSVCIYSIIYQDYVQVTRVFALEKSSLPRIVSIITNSKAQGNDYFKVLLMGLLKV